MAALGIRSGQGDFGFQQGQPPRFRQGLLGSGKADIGHGGLHGLPVATILGRHDGLPENRRRQLQSQFRSVAEFQGGPQGPDRAVGLIGLDPSGRRQGPIPD